MIKVIMQVHGHLPAHAYVGTLVWSHSVAKLFANASGELCNCNLISVRT